MIPRLSEICPTQKLYLDFLEQLKNSGFEGDLNPDYANRVVLATDNSIYQVLPQGVVYPKNLDDLVRVTTLSQQEKFKTIKLSARGGGTGTNGQSLTDGLVVDISKHMNQVLEINADEGWVRVQTGVVKDQLNAALKPHGLFFAPELSTSNRATIGGMINTDASGQGSVLYGKTRDHVIDLKTVLIDGSVLNSKAVNQEELATLENQSGLAGKIYSTAKQIFDENKQAIIDKFPKLNRCLTGYDLAHIRDENDQVNLNNLLCGSEGTLGFIAEAKLNVLPIPKYAALVNVRYDSFESSLRDAQALMECNPTSIETVDSTVLNLAKNDLIWATVSEHFPEKEGEEVAGINLVEYTDNDEEQLKARIQMITDALDTVSGQPGKAIGYSIAWGQHEVKQIWAMRKKAVGLLGNAQGEARPIPFVEDTAVPPENLADFIMEFRSVLDAHDLKYGMFGHVDAGVLHVRPAIDMKNKQQATLVRGITNQVVELVKKYGGLLWGEHGKGVRSEFAPEFFGELYPLIQKVKFSFDPLNQLNPGKIATPENSNEELLKIDEVKTRGELDGLIATDSWEHFSEAMYCNGNGACYNWDPNDAMCPSWKVTRQRKHSPKGRASLMREWLKLLSERETTSRNETAISRSIWNIVSFLPKVVNNINARFGQYDFSHEVHDSMSACLACKSCTGACPIKVDVPEFRAKFLELYYSRYLRPLKDYFIGLLEFIIPYLALIPSIYNAPMKTKPVQWVLKNIAGMVDSPLIHKLNLSKEMKRLGVQFASVEKINQLSDSEKAKSVILVQDAFTSYFDTQTVSEILECLQRLGFKPWVMKFSPNGKPLHVHGFLKMFIRTATNTSKRLKALSNTGVPLIGIDPSMTLVYRSEYTKYSRASVPEVKLIQEFLTEQLETLETVTSLKNKDISAKLMGHCTEKTNAANSVKQWQQVFDTLGAQLSEIPVGCCGMAGTFGHETRNYENSKEIYRLSWESPVNAPENQGILLSTGYSCRSQAKRMDQKQLIHPLQFLLQQLKQHQ